MKCYNFGSNEHIFPVEFCQSCLQILVSGYFMNILCELILRFGRKRICFMKVDESDTVVLQIWVIYISPWSALGEVVLWRWIFRRLWAHLSQQLQWRLQDRQAPSSIQPSFLKTHWTNCNQISLLLEFAETMIWVTWNLTATPIYCKKNFKDLLQNQ